MRALTGHPIPPPGPSVPPWLCQLAASAGTVEAADLSRFTPPPDGSGRHSAVLMLFAGQRADPATAGVLLLLRAATLRSHAGQVAFPGGASDAGDASPAATALREAAEEVGVRPESVDVLAELPAVYLPPSGFVVTPVLGHWREPHPVGVVDAAEVAGVELVRLADLVDPANRFTVRHPSGFTGPGFAASGLFIWGFTASLLDRLLRLAGWERPWDRQVCRPLPP
jgi:8-oxo-dGTP pyrophosphatase MutT (NUDIX family)